MKIYTIIDTIGEHLYKLLIIEFNNSVYYLKLKKVK